MGSNPTQGRTRGFDLYNDKFQILCSNDFLSLLTTSTKNQPCCLFFRAWKKSEKDPNSWLLPGYILIESDYIYLSFSTWFNFQANESNCVEEESWKRSTKHNMFLSFKLSYECTKMIHWVKDLFFKTIHICLSTTLTCRQSSICIFHYSPHQNITAGTRQDKFSVKCTQ